MDMRNAKTVFFELPVVVICRCSLLLQPKFSWSSTVRVAVQYVEPDDPHECVGEKSEEFVAEASDTCLCAGILPPPQLSKDEEYAKGWIDQNKGFVEVGNGWPACQRKSLRLHIVWHDLKSLLEIDSRSQCQQTKNAATSGFVLLIGARFVEAFSMYQQRREMLMSSSILPFHEQQVAHEIKLLLVHIVKSLQNRLALDSSLTQNDVEERVVVNIMNILVDVQLFDDKKVIEMPSVLKSGDQVVSGNYLRILKHKVHSELVVLLQNVLAFSKDSGDHNRLDEREDGARERVSYMRRAVLEIIELLKHTSQAGDSCTETYLEENCMGKHEVRGREKLNKCVQEQMLRIQWKLLLAVLEKKDPVSLENILCSVCDEDKRRLLKIMAGPLGLVCHEELDEGEEKLDEELMKRGASTSTCCNIKADLRGHGPGALEANGGASRGYYVKSSDEIFGQSLFQKKREPEQHSHAEGTKQGDEHTSSGAVRTHIACQSAHVNEPGGRPNSKISEQHAKKRCVQGLEAGGQLECQEQTFLDEDAKESHLQGQWAVGQSDCQEHAPIEDQAYRTGRDLDMEMHPPHASASYDGGDSGIKSPAHIHQLQVLPTHDADPSQASGDWQLTNQDALENAADSLIPDHTFSHAASSSPSIASSNNVGDDDFHDDAEISKARRRKRRNRKPHRVKGNQDLPCSRHSRLQKTRSLNRKIWLLVMTMAFIFGATVMGIFLVQSDFSSSQRTKEHKTFARGFLP